MYSFSKAFTLISEYKLLKINELYKLLRVFYCNTFYIIEALFAAESAQTGGKGEERRRGAV